MGQALSAAIQQLHHPPTPTHQALVSYLAILLLRVHKMMESICLDDEDTDPDWDIIEHGYAEPRTPSTLSDNHNELETDTRPQQYDSSEPGSEDEYPGGQGAPKRKKGGYDSRIEQIIYENPDLPILIVDAGKSSESGGKYIVYTIRTGV